MKHSIYFVDADILQICLSDKPIVRETSQDWHTHVAYVQDGTVVEIVILDAGHNGVVPLYFSKSA